MGRVDQFDRSLRVDELLEGKKHRRKTITSPEGVPLTVQVATAWERIGAFTLDMIFMGLAVALIFILMGLLFFSGTRVSAGMTLMLFISFLVRNMYFLHFELAWQGRTPGKKICGLRVINRNGGELTPSAIIARNLTREVEFFLPMSLLMSTAFSASPIQHLALCGWVLIIALLPLFNKDRLRAGDIIGGTQVIAMPKRLLLPDLAMHHPVVKLAPENATGISGQSSLHRSALVNNPDNVAPAGMAAPAGAAGATGTSGVPDAAGAIGTTDVAGTGGVSGGTPDVTGAGNAAAAEIPGANPHAASPGMSATGAVTAAAYEAVAYGAPAAAGQAPYIFTHGQLSVYGAFELQVLEDFLRKPASQNTQKELVLICGKIMRKIGWTAPVQQNDVRRFLNDFYAAQRAELERAQLFGKLREDKNSAPVGKK